MSVVALLTDFGARDWYAGVLRGVIASRAPKAAIMDITHEIPPQDIVAGAFTLAAAAPWFPKGAVFLAVVDPGVGSGRKLLAAQADEKYFVGPDNGLLWLALRQAARRRIIHLTNAKFWMPGVSRTFHGRDILAPVAAYLARGGALSALGPALTWPKLAETPMPAVERLGRSLRGAVIHVDAFGNLITNIPAGLTASRARAPAIRYQRRRARVVSSYQEGKPGELIAVVNSLGLLELAIREGSAAWTHNAKRGDLVEVA